METNRIEIPVRGLGGAFDGLRVLHLTDFHFSRHVPSSLIARAVETGRREACDLVALTGDFVHDGFRQIDAICRLVGRFRAPLGVFAVLGNHDYSVRNALGVRRYGDLYRSVTAGLRQEGIIVLENQHRILERNGGSIAVAGVADLWSGEANLHLALDAIPAVVPRILLAHNPRTIESLNGRRCDLVLSGHTHGGQVNLPRFGRPTLGRRMKRFAAGLIPFGGGYLYVNKGIGFTMRFRYKVRPEIAVLTLRSRGSNNNDQTADQPALPVAQEN